MKLPDTLFGIAFVFCLIASITFISWGMCSRDKSKTCSTQSTIAIATCVISIMAFVAGEVLRGGSSQ